VEDLKGKNAQFIGFKESAEFYAVMDKVITF
jgi:hypothetical protein